MRKYDNFEFEKPLINAPANEALDLVIIIPAFNEKDLDKTLNSLFENTNVSSPVEIIIVINEGEHTTKEISDFHESQYQKLLALSKTLDLKNISLYPIYVKNIEAKFAGSGMARKLGMDEAYRRFEQANNLYGIISNLDADTIVDNNYISVMLAEAKLRTKTKAYSIHYEHLLSEDLTEANKQAIISYELHLRYYINMQKLLGFPFAFQIMGSAMAVKAFAYAEAFGMNKRQAGEDFYFLQKFIKTGFFKNISSTTVYPSARISQRVPFGTGRALYDIMVTGKTYDTYNFKSFESLSTFTDNLEKLYYDFELNYPKIDSKTREFLELRNFKKRYNELKSNTKDFKGFEKRFYRWFDAFILMKYLHFVRDKYFPNISIYDATEYLFNKLNFEFDNSLEKALLQIREYDKS